MAIEIFTNLFTISLGKIYCETCTIKIIKIKPNGFIKNKNVRTGNRVTKLIKQG